MTAHKLAALLLTKPDLPVCINGWSSDEGFTYEVTEATAGTCSFRGEHDDHATPKTAMGYEEPRQCVCLGYSQIRR